MTLDPISGLRHLRNERSDRLLTVLTGVLILLIFVIAPLHAVGITAFHLFAIGLLLAIIGAMVIISNSPTALALMSIALVANIAVFFPATVLPCPLPPPYLGRRMVDHRGHSRDRGHSGRVQARPCHISQNYRSYPAVSVDRSGLCNTLCFCRPVKSGRD
jgi:hypothetical protein